MLIQYHYHYIPEQKKISRTRNSKPVRLTRILKKNTKNPKRTGINRKESKKEKGWSLSLNFFSLSFKVNSSGTEVPATTVDLSIFQSLMVRDLENTPNRQHCPKCYPPSPLFNWRTNTSSFCVTSTTPFFTSFRIGVVSIALFTSINALQLQGITYRGRDIFFVHV